MKIKADNTKPNKKKTQILCSLVSEKSNELIELGKLNPKLNGALKQSLKEIKGKIGDLSIIQTFGTIPANKILLEGIGPKNKITTDILRMVSGNISQKVRSLGISEFSLIVPEKFPINVKSFVTAVVEGATLSMYSFNKYKKEKSQQTPSLSILISNPHKVQEIISKAQIVSEGVLFARSIANLPPNDCPPYQLVRFAKDMARKNKLICKVFSKKEIKQKKFGGITAVGQGSVNEPKLIVLEHHKGKRNDKPIVIVGKAVTFDTGGISLKPSDKMDEMKFDKCGGCTVLGIMKAVSELKLPINLVGIIPSVENMPGRESYRPGDIVRLYSGKTAEILNTDAEGRLILADALSYGEKKYSPSVLIDFATLTGACIVALGNNVAGLVSNDKKLANNILNSSEKTSEEVWELPLNQDYMDMIKSNVADMKNIGKGRAAGTITAAAFLANAINNTPWAHIDIAGTAWTQDATKKKSYNPKGATGFGVRLVIDFLSRLN